MSYPCLCGYVIKDNIYPCRQVGDLKWQPESENASQDALQASEDFLRAVENGSKDEWLRGFFYVGELSRVVDTDGPDRARRTLEQENFYLTADMATIITDIMSRFERKEGHSVWKCPKCERLYIQEEYRSDDYECFEKRQGYTR